MAKITIEQELAQTIIEHPRAKLILSCKRDKNTPQQVTEQILADEEIKRMVANEKRINPLLNLASFRQLVIWKYIELLTKD